MWLTIRSHFVPKGNTFGALITINYKMKKVLTLSVITLLALNFCIAQELSKDEKKRLREELKIYMSDLNGYKAKKDDIQATLDSNEAQIKALKEAYKSQADVRMKMEAYEAEIAKVRTENTELQSFNEAKVEKAVAEVVAEKMDSIGKTLPVATESTETTTSNAPVASGSTSTGSSQPKKVSNKVVPGTSYKVQIGLYKNFNINRYFEGGKEISYEVVNGNNRYVIGSFDNEQTAEQFVEDIRKMGIKDAFVAKYENGKRVN